MTRKLQLSFLVMFITILTKSVLAQELCTDPDACNFGLSSTAEYTQLDFTSQVTAALNSYPQGISVGDEVVFSVEFANEGITMANANVFDGCQSFGGLLLDCNAQAWEMAVASPYKITYESGYSETGTFTHIVIVDGGFELNNFGGGWNVDVKDDRMYFYDGQNDIYQLGFDGSITGVSNDLLSEIATFDNTTFDIAFYLANWGTWGTYHYDYATPQNNTQVDLVSSTCYSFDSDNDGICDAVLGCTVESACNYAMEATNDDGSCIIPVQDCSVCNETNDGLEIVDADEDGICDSEDVQGCQDENAINFNSWATDAGDCTYAVVVLGCTYEGASNYNPLATIDNNSCVFPSAEVLGCTDQGALNYHPAATTDDSSCTYPSICDSDFNNDGEVNSGDLLVFLGSFGFSCD